MKHGIKSSLSLRLLLLLVLHLVTGTAAQPEWKAYTQCASCIAAGFGWSAGKGKCGMYKNFLCPEDTAATPASSSAPSSTEPAAAAAPPQNPAEVVSEDGREDPRVQGYIQEVYDLYRLNAPEKLQAVPNLLKRYAGREEQLVYNLRDFPYWKGNPQKDEKPITMFESFIPPESPEPPEIPEEPAVYTPSPGRGPDGRRLKEPEAEL